MWTLSGGVQAAKCEDHKRKNSRRRIYAPNYSLQIQHARQEPISSTYGKIINAAADEPPDCTMTLAKAPGRSLGKKSAKVALLVF